jgi:hypothetical protein
MEWESTQKSVEVANLCLSNALDESNLVLVEATITSHCLHSWKLAKTLKTTKFSWLFFFLKKHLPTCKKLPKKRHPLHIRNKLFNWFLQLHLKCYNHM